eukprot:scaffold95533_cov36-Tisochrysis_lutea.AAC.2
MKDRGAESVTVGFALRPSWSRSAWNSGGNGPPPAILVCMDCSRTLHNLGLGSSSPWLRILHEIERAFLKRRARKFRDVSTQQELVTVSHDFQSRGVYAPRRYSSMVPLAISVRTCMHVQHACEWWYEHWRMSIPLHLGWVYVITSSSTPRTTKETVWEKWSLP